MAGVRPASYRAPMWELNYRSPALLAARGFRYDSSLMDGDAPYRIACAGSPGGQSLIEMPIHWGIDDWEQYAYLPRVSGSGLIESPAKALDLPARRLVPPELPQALPAGGLEAAGVPTLYAG